MEKVVARVPAISFDPSLNYIVVVMKNRPGILAKVLVTLAGFGVNVLEGIHSRGETEDMGAWIALIKVPRNAEESNIVRAVERVEGVAKVALGARRYGPLIMPPVELVWELGPGMPVSIWRHMFLSKVYEGLTMAMGAAGHAVFFHQGFQAGVLIYEFWRDLMPTNDPRTLIEGAFNVLQRFGWFTDPEIVELKPATSRITLRLRNSLEAYGRRSDKPLCYFLAGLFSGYTSRALGKDVKFDETKCQARGDPYCLFTTRTKR